MKASLCVVCSWLLIGWRPAIFAVPRKCEPTFTAKNIRINVVQVIFELFFMATKMVNRIPRNKENHDVTSNRLLQNRTETKEVTRTIVATRN